MRLGARKLHIFLLPDCLTSFFEALLSMLFPSDSSSPAYTRTVGPPKFGPKEQQSSNQQSSFRAAFVQNWPTMLVSCLFFGRRAIFWRTHLRYAILASCFCTFGIRNSLASSVPGCCCSAVINYRGAYSGAHYG